MDNKRDELVLEDEDTPNHDARQRLFQKYLQLDVRFNNHWEKVERRCRACRIMDEIKSLPLA